MERGRKEGEKEEEEAERAREVVGGTESTTAAESGSEVETGGLKKRVLGAWFELEQATRVHLVCVYVEPERGRSDVWRVWSLRRGPACRWRWL